MTPKDKQPSGAAPRTPETIRIRLNGKEGTIDRKIYVQLKTEQLREFGYGNLSEQEVDGQITALLERKTLGNGLTVIGGFMEDEVVALTPPPGTEIVTSGKVRKGDWFYIDSLKAWGQVPDSSIGENIETAAVARTVESPKA